MLDMSWGEVMVIGAVALIVIGPKDLPKALRTVGQVTGKLRRMAAEFQGQFNEAMREAELNDVKQQLQGMNNSVSGFNPIQTLRDELKTSIETPVTGQDKPSPPEGSVQEPAVAGPASEAQFPPRAEPVVELPLPSMPPVDDPAEAIAESLRREAEIETQKAAAQAAQDVTVVKDRTDVKAR